jgi:hypothetical protein
MVSLDNSGTDAIDREKNLRLLVTAYIELEEISEMLRTMFPVRKDEMQSGGFVLPSKNIRSDVTPGNSVAAHDVARTGH